MRETYASGAVSIADGGTGGGTDRNKTLIRLTDGETGEAVLSGFISVGGIYGGEEN